jgi:hypothetical protein
MGLEFSVEIKDPQKRNLDLRKHISYLNANPSPTQWTKEGTTHIGGLVATQSDFRKQILKLGMVWDSGRAREEAEERAIMDHVRKNMTSEMEDAFRRCSLQMKRAQNANKAKLRSDLSRIVAV